MYRVSILVIALIAVIVGGYMWNEKKTKETAMVEQKEAKEKRLSVVATFYPLEEVAKNVGNARVSVATIVPAGAEPHDFEPTQQQILATYQADIFLLNGAGLDPWAEKIRPELEERGVKVVQMSELVEVLPSTHEEPAEEQKETTVPTPKTEEIPVKPEEEHEEGEFDPHFWLDPVHMQVVVKAVASAFAEKDPKGAPIFKERRDAYLKELQKLDEEYRKVLSSCRLDTVVTSHNAFSYLGKRYGFTVLSLSGISPEAEPSPRRVAELAQIIKQKGIKHVFFETLVSPKVSETLARETGTETLVFNPLEGLTDEERRDGKTYLSIMRSNLDNLQRALQCQK